MKYVMIKIALSRSITPTSTKAGYVDINRCIEDGLLKLRITYPNGYAEFKSTFEKVNSLVVTANQYLDNIGAHGIQLTWIESEWLYNIDNSELITFCRKNKIHLMDCVVNTSRFMNGAPNVGDINNRAALFDRYHDVFKGISELNAVELIFNSLILSRMHLNEAHFPNDIIRGIIQSYQSKDISVNDIYTTSKRIYTYITLLVDMSPDSDFWCEKINKMYPVSKAPEDHDSKCSITSILRSETLDRFINTLIDISNGKPW